MSGPERLIMTDYDDYHPPPMAARIFVGKDHLMADLLVKHGLEAEYRGTDLVTGYELWQHIDPPFSFFIDPSVSRVVVYNIGSDPDRDT